VLPWDAGRAEEPGDLESTLDEAAEGDWVDDEPEAADGGDGGPTGLPDAASDATSPDAWAPAPTEAGVLDAGADRPADTDGG